MPYKRREDRIANDRRRYEMNREAMKAGTASHYAEHRDEIRARRKELNTEDRRAVNAARQRARYKTLRAEVIAAYGGKCACCGEDEALFLELDHVQNNGAAHRREIGRGSHATYGWVKSKGFPADF